MTAKVKTLVISNDQAMLTFLQQNLSENDYHLTSTQQTDEELKGVLDKELPDLVIMDVIMPDLDGIEICLRVRQWCQAPIMMLSAWGAGEGNIRGLDLGADSYLTEPFGIDELMARITETLQRNFVAINNSFGKPSGVSIAKMN